MKAHRENPDSEEMSAATKGNMRDVFAAKMQATIRKCRRDGYCPNCGMFTSQCDCWDTVNGQD